jgi:hypothetical protein
MSAMPAKRARDGNVKQEAAADQVQADQVQADQLQAAQADHAASGWDSHMMRVRGDRLANAIKEFTQAFLVVGDHVPVVLHFTINEWAKGFTAALLDLGLDEEAAKQQVIITMSIGLAHWAKNVLNSKTGKELCLSPRWLIEDYVSEALRLGYIEDEQRITDTILKTIKNLPSQ